MTLLTKPLTRETNATRFERGKHRPVVVTIEPPNLVGFRLKGTRQTYYLPAEQLYVRAVAVHAAAENARKAKERKEKAAARKRLREYGV